MAINETLLVTPAAMGAIDAAAISSGLDGYGLMQAAGAHVAAVFLRHYPQALRAVILCGPGNNGGDGHVCARLLRDSGVDVVRHGSEPRPGGDAARARADCPGPVLALADWHPRVGDVIIDALFGAGLDRPVGAECAAVIDRARAAGVPVIAVDLPSGLSGRTGVPTGACFSAAHTVTFAALKPGHLLMPGRALCGQMHLCDIGIPARLIESADPIWRNHPGLYRDHLPRSDVSQHKYSRGHLGVFSGPLLSGGAARLAAMTGLRAGAGLVTIASPPGAVMAQAAHLTAIMQRSIADETALADWLADRRLSGFVIGPGFGDLEKARGFTAQLAATGRPVVLDADGLTAFARNSTELSGLFLGPTRLVITPHEGEFRRLFPLLAEDAEMSKIDRARLAAAALNAVVVYKGADTVIASPDGRSAVNADAPPWLATAGSGDVLSGIVGGLLAQGMAPFEAACAGVAMHGAAALSAGEGMTAEDLVTCVRIEA
ncbi:MAG: NAD(P)H-hydrate dehydratase [Hoeflea sp.]|nr:NAD(P)H-hydrate dehydratase [Hoeflea sp.]